MERIWKKWSNNAFNVLYIKEKEIYRAYFSKSTFTLWKTNNSSEWFQMNPKKVGIILLEKMSPLLKAITLKHHGYFYCLNCIHSFARKSKFESHEKLHKTKNVCLIALSTQKHKISEFNRFMKSDKMPYIISANIESLI